MRTARIIIAFGIVLAHGAIASGKNPYPPRQSSEPGVFLRLDDFQRRAGQPPVAIDFDDQSPDLDISNLTICGVTFAAGRAPLVVVRGDQTMTPMGFTNLCGASNCRLNSTSGAQLLSPGGAVLGPGPNPAVEDDDIVLTFDPPVCAVGFDLISQNADWQSHTRIEIISTGGTTLYSGTVPISGTDQEIFGGRRLEMLGDSGQRGPNADFWGFVSDKVNIRTVRIDEQDDDNVCPDSNIGIDTLRFAPASCGLVGDLNADGVVTDVDAKLLADQWGDHDPSTMGGPMWCAADLNRDTKVDAEDLAILLARVRIKS